VHSADILIVGAGPAGCAAAYDLAHAGRNVLLLDKRSFPRHKACACGLTRKTLKVLRYSVDSVVERVCRDVILQEAGTEAFRKGVRTADKSLEVRVHTRQPFCATAVRERFDDFCLQQTLAAGPHITMRKIEGIAAAREFADHVELDVTLPGSVTETLTARAVLGADGSNGQMRRLAAGLDAQSDCHSERSEESASPRDGEPGLREAHASALPPEPTWYARGFALEATVPYAALPTKLPAGDAAEDLVFDFAPISGGYGWLFPKGDHINIGVGGFVPQAATVNHDDTRPPMLYEQVTRTLLADYTRHKLGVDLTAIPEAHVTGQYLGLGGHAYVPQGRMLLAGDAAGLVDPLTGEGIHSAIVSGQAFAAAVLESGMEQGTTLAAAYARHLRPLQETLAFSHRAAQSFYREPSRGFKIMRTPLLRRLMLKTYADGLPHTELLAKLARRVA
jgi:flavin-dependent dehydrogenase